MMPPEFIAIIIIAHIIGGAITYIVLQKKKGKKCVGCPYADSCSKKCSCNKK